MKKKIIIAASIFAVIIGLFIFFGKKSTKEEWKEIAVTTGSFKIFVTASGAIQPENKISITPPISGRIDQILINEGEKVKKGQILAWMSSTDRAALLDSARAQKDDSAKDWETVYKPTPIIAPASGLIISRNIVVGQTINQQSILFDLSDRLVIHADVDETDVGKIQIGQKAEVRVDSFPEHPLQAKVFRIAHQSLLRNNINTYEVLLLPNTITPQFRAGMTASINFLLIDKKETFLLPTWIAEGKENTSIELKVIKQKSQEVEKRIVDLGKSDGENIEVLSGLQEGDKVRYLDKKFFNAQDSNSPFNFMGRPKKKRP